MGCVPGPCGGASALLAPLQHGVTPGLPAAGAGLPMGCSWRQGEEATSVLLGICAARPREDFRGSGLDGEDADAGVMRGCHVLMSPGVCLAACSRAWHRPSCATGAGAGGSSSSVTCDGPSGSPPLVGFCPGQHELRLCPSHSCPKQRLGIL